MTTLFNLSLWTSSCWTNANNNGLLVLFDNLHLCHDHLPLPLLRLLLGRASQVDRGAEEGAGKAGGKHFLQSLQHDFNFSPQKQAARKARPTGPPETTDGVDGTMEDLTERPWPSLAFGRNPFPGQEMPEE